MTSITYPRMKQLMSRFDNRYIPEPNSGCWLWTGALTDRGYGRLRDGRGDILAHRISYMIHHGPIPAWDECGHRANILHSCDNPCCVNPDHLRIGTQRDNATDMMQRGRFNAGDRKKLSNHTNSKLTEQQVLMARELHSKGLLKLKPMARSLGVNHKTLRDAVLGITWRSLTPPITF